MTLVQTQYARSGDADIAYRMSGDSPPDVVLVYDWGSHIEAVAEQPLFDEFLQSLGRFSRVIWFDMRGIGMSRSFVGGVLPVESWVDDLAAVMDAVGSTEATVVAQGHAAQMAIIAAATDPELVSSLVLFNGLARLARADDYPAGVPASVQEIYREQIERQWGTGAFAMLFGPSVAERPGVVEWWGPGRALRRDAEPRPRPVRFDPRARCP